MNAIVEDLELLEFEMGVNAAPVSIALGLTGLAAEAMVIRPEVVRLMAAGVPEKEVCAALNVSKRVLRRCMREADFGALMEVEIRRIMRHMRKRDLSQEKYLQLTTSVAMLVDKMRLLRDEPTSIQRGQTITIIENLTLGLHGRGRDASERISAINQIDVTPSLCELPQLPESASEDATEPIDLVDSVD